MPKEIRKILFSAGEVRDAIGAYLDASKADARARHVTSVALQKGSDLGALVKLNIALPGGRNEMILNTEQLGAALIIYCKQRGVPLPKSGKKILDRQNDGISLEIDIA